MWYHAVLCHFSYVQLCAALWTVAHQAPLSMGFSRQEYWNGLPYLPSEVLPDPGVEPVSLKSPALAGRFFTTGTTWEAPSQVLIVANRAIAALNIHILIKHSIPLPKVASEVQNPSDWRPAKIHLKNAAGVCTSLLFPLKSLMVLSLTEFVCNVYIWGLISLVLTLHIFQL